MVYDYLQQSDDTNKDERSQTPSSVSCVIPLIWSIEATLLLEVRVMPSLIRGSIVTERKEKETSGVLVMFFFFFLNLNTECMGALIVQIHTDKCTFLYAYFTSKIFLNTTKSTYKIPVKPISKITDTIKRPWKLNLLLKKELQFIDNPEKLWNKIMAFLFKYLGIISTVH